MNVIPKPKKTVRHNGSFNLRSVRNIEIDEEFTELLPLVRECLFDKLNIYAEAKRTDGRNAFKIIYDDKVAPEGYKLNVYVTGAELTASDNAGILYGIQTLRIATKADTLLPDCVLGCVEIYDYPDNQWRGALLDVARHFYTVSEVKRFIDLMLLHKLNVLHLHLTDDQGWRIEIKKYPLLTKIGSKRKKTHIHGWRSLDDDGRPHEGFYTQEDIAGLVEYAAARAVSIVPEIDMPAHFAAAFAAYGHLACRDKKVEVPWYFGGRFPSSQGITDWNRSACIGKPSTFEFIYDVIDEVTELFPAPYFHIGGDEAPRAEWEKCPNCRQLMEKESLKDTKALEGYFINKINGYVKSKGKILIAWNEALEGGNLDRDVIVQYWTPKYDPNVARFIQKGGRVLMSKHRHFYLDMPHSMVGLKSVYKFKPFIDGITENYADQIIGSEAALWTEWIPSFKKLEFQAFPRLTAAAETSWGSDPGGNYREFKTRLKDFLGILGALNVNYAKKTCYLPFLGLLTTAKWAAKDPDVEFIRNEKLKNKNGR